MKENNNSTVESLFTKIYDSISKTTNLKQGEDKPADKPADKPVQSPPIQSSKPDDVDTEKVEDDKQDKTEPQVQQNNDNDDDKKTN